MTDDAHATLNSGRAKKYFTDSVREGTALASRSIAGVSVKDKNDKLVFSYKENLIRHATSGNEEEVIRVTNEAIESGVVSLSEGSKDQWEALDSIATERVHRRDKELTTGIESTTNQAYRYARSGDAVVAVQHVDIVHGLIDERYKLNLISYDESVAQKQEVVRGLEGEALKQMLDMAYEVDGIDGAHAMISELEGNAPEGWTVGEWETFLTSEQKRIGRTDARHKEIGGEEKKAIELRKSIDRGRSIYEGIHGADPKAGSESRKDVENLYDVMVAEAGQMTADETVEFVRDFVSSTGVVPKQLASELRASMRSGDPTLAAKNADLISSIIQMNPASAKDIDETTRQIAEHINASMAGSSGANAHADPNAIPDAVERARAAQAYTPQEKELAAQLSQSASKELESNFKAMIESNSPSRWWKFGDGVEIPQAMYAEFKYNFERHLPRVKDVDAAQKLAVQDSLAFWAVNNVDGTNRWMKYSPETYYSVQGHDNEWMSVQFEEMKAAYNLPEGSRLVFDVAVARSKRPSYPILMPDENGVMVEARDAENRLIRFWPDWSETEMARSDKAESDKAAEYSAKHKRIQETRQDVISREIHGSVVAGTGKTVLKADYYNTPEGIDHVARVIVNKVAGDKITPSEAKKALSNYGVPAGHDAYDRVLRVQAKKLSREKARKDYKESQEDRKAKLRSEAWEDLTAPFRAINDTTQAMQRAFTEEREANNPEVTF
jgi:hypothetical protein